jgi:hypothetical protein
MLKVDIVEGVYLKQTTERHGIPAGLIGVVHKVGTDWIGEWMFQLHYLNPPGGMRKTPVPPWSLNLRETDLVGFELIGTWTAAQALLASAHSTKPKKEPKLPRLSAVMGKKVHLNQLRLFEDF